jgi:hypothetical protein
MKHIIYLSLLLFSSALLSAQPKDSTKKARMETLKKLRRDLYVKKLSLTEDQAQKFFPVYDEFELKQREAKQAFRNKWGNKRPEDLTDKEAEEFLNDATKLRESELSLTKLYHDKLKPVIGAKKLLQLRRVQREVREELLSKAKELKGKRPPHPGPGGRNGHRPGGRNHPPPPPPDEF